MTVFPPQNSASAVPSVRAGLVHHSRSSDAFSQTPLPPSSSLARPRQGWRWLLFAAITILLPLALNLIPAQTAAVVPYSGSRCANVDAFPNVPTSCSGGCCALRASMLTTQRCYPSGVSCYQPVLDTLWAVMLFFLMLLLWSIVACCAACAFKQAEEVQRAASSGAESEAAGQYHRMDGVVAMR